MRIKEDLNGARNGGAQPINEPQGNYNSYNTPNQKQRWNSNNNGKNPSGRITGKITIIIIKRDHTNNPFMAEDLQHLLGGIMGYMTETSTLME